MRGDVTGLSISVLPCGASIHTAATRLALSISPVISGLHHRRIQPYALQAQRATRGPPDEVLSHWDRADFTNS
jgi:hypothetical protein